MITKIAEDMLRPEFLTNNFGTGKYRTDPKISTNKSLRDAGKFLKKNITNIGAAGLSSIPAKYNPLSKSAIGVAWEAAKH
jgi:hypothetical protein